MAALVHYISNQVTRWLLDPQDSTLILDALLLAPCLTNTKNSVQNKKYIIDPSHNSGHLYSLWIGSPNLPCSSKSLNSERSTGTTLGMAYLSWNMATKPLLLFLLVDQLCLAQRAPRYLSVFTIVRFNADACLGFYTNRCTFFINLFGTE